jgi:GNAT superfamily N-acetyltransferase
METYEQKPIRIEQLDIRDSDLIIDWVLKLLEELGEEGDDLGELQKEKVMQAWRESNGRFLALAARGIDGTMLGLLTLTESFAIYANGSYGIINEMIVSTAARSQGAGAMLIRAAVSYGRERGWSRIDVTAPESDRWLRSRQFYEQQGFTFAGPKLKLQL